MPPKFRPKQNKRKKAAPRPGASKGRTGGEDESSDDDATFEESLAAGSGPTSGAGGGSEADADRLKDAGNEHFKAGRFAEAVAMYSAAIAISGRNHVLFSNRSAAHLGRGDARSAEADARKCVELDPSWAKGYLRLGDAIVAQGRATDAIAEYAKGLAKEPANQALLQAVMRASGAAAAASGTSTTSGSGSGGAHAAAAAATASSTTSSGSSSSTSSSSSSRLDPSPVIGIDLGTTFSCVAIWKDGHVEVIADEAGQRTMPSVVAFRGEERLVGHAAMSQAASNPTNTVFDAKRLIGQRFSESQVQRDAKHFPFAVVEGPDDKPLIEVEYRGEKRRFAPEEISAMVLERMKSVAEKFLGHPVRRAVITVPAYFNDAQRSATKVAGEIAGLEVLRIINEPTAAALAYGLDQKMASEGAAAAAATAGSAEEDDVWAASERTGARAMGVASRARDAANVLIFDLGGGTFDVSLLTIEDGMFEVKATGGDTHLGGEDFDNAMVDFTSRLIQKQNGIDVRLDKRAQRRLRTACERAKRLLSSAVTANIELDGVLPGDEIITIPVSRAKFDSLNDVHFKRCIDTVRGVLSDAGVAPRQVSDIVLVGGSSRIIRVQDMLREFFGGKELCKSINPDEAVAYGAAVQGAILSGQRHSATESLLLVDVTPLSLGIETTGGVMSVVVKRNTPIPVRKTSRYSTEEDYQDAIDVLVFEGERQMTKDNNLLGEFTIRGIKRAKRGEPKIDVTFDIDVNGILNVTAVDAETGASARTTIVNARGRHSRDEVERMVRAAESNRASDAAARVRAQLRNALDRACAEISDGGSDADQERARTMRSWLTSAAGAIASPDELRGRIRLLVGDEYGASLIASAERSSGDDDEEDDV